MKKYLITTLVLLTSGLLASCTVTPLETGAQNVMLAQAASEPQCEKLGSVLTMDTNGSTVAYTSHKKLQTSQENVLKNKAFDMGGNVLVITKHETTYANTKKGMRVNTHRMAGDVYLCKSLSLEKPEDVSMVSDLKDDEK